MALDFKLSTIDFSELDYKNMGSWPLILRIGIIIFCCIIVLYLGHSYITSGKIAARSASAVSLEKLRQDYKAKYSDIMQLPQYKEQQVQLHKQLEILFNRLPQNNEVSQSVDSISTLGLNNQIIFRSIIPQKIIEHKFFYEMPIELSIEGTYNKILNFVYDVSALKNVIVFGDFDLKTKSASSAAGASKDADPVLIFSVTAKTFWRKDNADIGGKA